MNPSVNASGNDVLLLSDNVGGGAAAATARLLSGLLDMAVPCRWWHFSPPRSTPGNVTTLDPGPKRPPLERIIKNFNRPLADHLRRKRHSQKFREKLLLEPPGILNCHNIHSCGLNHDDLRWLPREIPIVWTMHDCWAFQPRAFEWRNLDTGEIEFVTEENPHNEAAARRHAFFTYRPDVVLVSPSRWLYREARSALGDAIRIEHIPNGICGETFQPSDGTAARRRLGMDSKKVWLGTSATHAYSRKGLDVLAKALQKMDVSRIGLLSWGQKPDLDFPDGLEVKFAGSISSESEISELYSACDLFVCPSRSDNLPNTVLESLACGVPIIGSDAGGIPDMVREGETGWSFQSDNPDSCSSAIQTAIASAARWPSMKQRCREIALQDYSLQRQATSYSKLFSSLAD